jgi:DNA-directed RNA polymerase subunit beta'
MAVHVPLSDAAQTEAREIMLATKNLLKPADGAAVVNPSQDIVLGCYYMTYDKFQDEKPVKYFRDTQEALQAYQVGVVKLQNKIAVPVEGALVETTVGRLLFNEILPEGMGYRNEPGPTAFGCRNLCNLRLRNYCSGSR